jgi:hypothetical protein
MARVPLITLRLPHHHAGLDRPKRDDALPACATLCCQLFRLSDDRHDALERVLLTARGALQPARQRRGAHGAAVATAWARNRDQCHAPRFPQRNSEILFSCRVTCHNDRSRGSERDSNAILQYTARQEAAEASRGLRPVVESLYLVRPIDRPTDHLNARSYFLFRRQPVPGQYGLLQCGAISRHALSVIQRRRLPGVDIDFVGVAHKRPQSSVASRARCVETTWLALPVCTLATSTRELLREGNKHRQTGQRSRPLFSVLPPRESTPISVRLGHRFSALRAEPHRCVPMCGVQDGSLAYRSARNGIRRSGPEAIAGPNAHISCHSRTPDRPVRHPQLMPCAHSSHKAAGIQAAPLCGP